MLRLFIFSYNQIQCTDELICFLFQMMYSDDDDDSVNDVMEVTAGSVSEGLDVDDLPNIEHQLQDDDMDTVTTDDNRLEDNEEDKDQSSDNDSEGDDRDNNENSLKMPERKRKDPAPIWKYAERVENGARCKFCRKLYKSKHGNTSNISRHVMEKHTNEPEAKLLKAEMEKKKERLILKQKLVEKRKSEQGQTKITNFTKKRGLIGNL